MLRYQFEANDVDESLHLIYCWEILTHDGDLVGRYVGKAKNGRRPHKHYARNVERLLAGRPYRLNKPDKFRPIHHALARAHRDGNIIVLRFICNARPEDINAVEQHWIKTEGCMGNEPWQLNVKPGSRRLR